MWSAAQRLKKIHRFDSHVGLNETIDQLAMPNCVHWHGHVMRREDGQQTTSKPHCYCEINLVMS